MKTNRFFKVLYIFALMLFCTVVSAEDNQAQIYEKDGNYYLKEAPKWVPIGGPVLIFIPYYEEGDILEIVKSGSNWTLSALSFSEFNAISPTLKNTSSYQRTDVNADNIDDIIIQSPSGTLQLLSSSNSGYSLNTAPQVSAISNQSTNEDAAKTISFTVNDPEQGNNLSFSVTSNNEVLLSSSSLNITGSGTSKSLVLTPNTNKHGSVTVTINVGDGLLTTTRSFKLTVASINDEPRITAIGNVVIDEDSSGSVNFTVSDVDTGASSLTVSAISSNSSLISNSALMLSGSSSERSLSFSPNANKFGVTDITVSASDGAATTSKIFRVTVNSVNDAPTVSILAPSSNSEFPKGAKFKAKASASDIDGSVKSVEFRLNSGPWYSDSSAPFEHEFESLQEGTQSIYFRSIDNNNLYSQTKSVNIKIFKSALPTANVATPAAPPLNVALPSTSDVIIGTVPGSFRVSESGSATYTIPIDVPKGIGGVSPQLSLEYASGAGNGPLGVGWNIGGLSEIQRCRKVLEEDGTVEEVKLIQSDAMCLDGVRLVNIGVKDYGDDGSEYRTKIDSNRRITAVGASTSDTSYFQVEAEDGATFTYAEVITTSDNVPIRWLISSIVDNAGNEILFNYNESGNIDSGTLGEGEVVLTSVVYSGNSVEYIYDATRQDTVEGFVFDDAYQNKALLKKVEIENHNGVALYNYNVKYHAYKGTSGRERIDSIQQCFGSSTSDCYPATSFEWTNTVVGLSSTVAQEVSRDYGGDFIGFKPFDFNGDGIPDLTQARFINSVAYIDFFENDGGKYTYRRSRSFTPPIDPVSNQKTIAWHVVDLDGDGNQEIIYLDGGDSTWHSFTFTRNGGSLDKFDVSNLNADADDQIIIFDTNTDGWQDIIHTENQTSSSGSSSLGRTRIYENQKDGSLVSMPLRFSYDNFEIPSSNWDYCYRNKQLSGSGSSRFDANRSPIIDVNGDGLPDLIMQRYNFVRYSDPISNCGGYSSVTVTYETNSAYSLERNASEYVYKEVKTFSLDQVNNGYNPANYSNFIGDVNGDGLQDFIIRKSLKNSDSVTWTCYQSSGRGIVNRGSCELSDLNNNSTRGVSLADINGDGRSDFIFNKDDNWYVRYSKGDSFGVNSQLIGGRLSKESETFKAGDLGLFLDATGNGQLDLIRVSKSDKRAYVVKSLESSNATRDLVSVVENGFGIKTKIHYAPLTDSSVYTKGVGAQQLNYGNGSKVFDTVSSMPVVSKVVSDAPYYDNSEATLSVEYHYEGLRVQAGGRGSLGFEAIYTYDPKRNVTTATSYYQNYPLIGFPRKTEQYLGARTTTPTNFVSSAENFYEVGELNGGLTVYPYLSQSQEKSYAIDDAGTRSQVLNYVATINEYAALNTDGTKVTDGSGNHYVLENSTVNTYSEKGAVTPLHQLITKNKFEQENVSNWWINRISQSTVTHIRNKDANGDTDAQLTIERASSFEYNSNTGMLEREVTGVGLGAQKQSISLHCYDTAGNRVGTHTYSSNFSLDCNSDPGAPHSVVHDSSSEIPKEFQFYRFKGAIYDSSKRFALSGRNAYFSESTVSEDDLNAFGQPTKQKDINGVVTKFAYNAAGSVIATANSIGQTATVERDYANGSLVEPSIDEPYYFVEKRVFSDKPMQFSYFDIMGRSVAIATQGFDGSFIIEVSRYDIYGRAVLTSLPFKEGEDKYFSEFQYDKFDRLQSSAVSHVANEEAPSSLSASVTRSSIAYSSNGLSKTTTVTSDLNSGKFSSQYEVKMEKVETSTKLGDLSSISELGVPNSISYLYDATGNLVRVTNVDGVDVINVYDEQGNKVEMNDPDKGTWTYSYNGLGELVSQEDAKGNIKTLFRDNLGRTIEEYSKDGKLNKFTSINFSYTDFVNGVSHLLQSETLSNANTFSKQYLYDSFGRLSVVRTTLDGETYAQKTTYDNVGRILQQFDADNTSLNACVGSGSDIQGLCFGVQNFFNEYGYLYKKAEARYAAGSSSNYITYLQVYDVNAHGKATLVERNNGKLKISTGYEASTGLASSVITKSNSVVIQNLVHTYDGLGNLRVRENVSSGFREEFDYDEVFRLKGGESSGKNAMPIASIDYDASDNGNISSKSDVQSGNTYLYGASNIDASKCNGYDFAGPHAVTKVGNKKYCYDENGNQTLEYTGSNLTRSISYDYRDKPVKIVANGETTTFEYGTRASRYKKVHTKGTTETITYYIGSVEVISGGNESGPRIRRYVPGGISNYYAVTGVVQNQYLLKDFLGSVDTIVNDDGLIIEKAYFDSWGKRTSLNVVSNWSADARTMVAPSLSDLMLITNRGFTGHEHVEHANIIHMNGRIYDPTLGRFLQADPFIQAPGNSQSYNRYSYVLNNPMSYTDPSGYFFSKLWKGIKKYAGVIAGIAVAVWCPACTATIWSSAFTGAAIGAGSAALNGGNVFKGALIGAFSGAAFFKVGQYFKNASGFNKTYNSYVTEKAFQIKTHTFGGLSLTSGQVAGQIASHAAVGGVTSVLQGGKFGHGFFSAGVTKGLGGAFLPGGSDLSTGEVVKGTVISALIGGTASEISGGKFANGAQTAAFQYLFNQVSKPKTVGRVVRGKVYHVKKWECATAACVAAQANIPIEGNEEYFNAVLQNDKENLTDALTVGSVALGGAGLYVNSLRIYFWSIGIGATNLAVNPNDPNALPSLALTTISPPLKFIDETIAVGVSSYQVLVEAGLAADRFQKKGND